MRNEKPHTMTIRNSYGVNSPKFDSIVVGNVGIDTNVYLQTNKIDFSVESNYTHNLDYVGQAGGYSARGYAQLGYKTAFIGFIGEDFNGQFVRKEFAHDGINTEALFIDKAGTSRSINIVYPNGNRKNFYDGKSHMTLKPDIQICTKILQKGKLAHFSIPNWARMLLPITRKLGLTIACDLQDIVSLDDKYRDDFIEFADILFFSNVNHPDPAPLMEKILDKYPEKILISGMGHKGCALGTKSSIRYFPPFPMNSPVIDSNGAGDALATGFLSSYLLENLSLEESILRGQIAARHACNQKANSSQLITRQQIENLTRPYRSK